MKSKNFSCVQGIVSDLARKSLFSDVHVLNLANPQNLGAQIVVSTVRMHPYPPPIKKKKKHHFHKKNMCDT